MMATPIIRRIVKADSQSTLAQGGMIMQIAFVYLNDHLMKFID